MHNFESISSILKGTACYEVGKGGLTLWIGFGDKIKVNRKEKRLFYLIIQSPWRFLQDKKIILASGDMYKCLDETKAFEVGNDFNSIYDEKVKKLNMKLSHGIKVAEVSFSDTGDITLVFDNKIVFQSFIDDSTKDEFWRFLSNKTKSSEHVVFYDL